MKSKLITNLKGRVLLVSTLGKEDYNLTLIGKDSVKEIFISGEYYTLPVGKWQLLSTLKDLTDSDCEGLVEFKNHSGLGIKVVKIYKDYSSGLFVNPAKESFLSALETSGVLFENPMGDLIPELDENDLWDVGEQDSQVMAQLNYDIDKWQEAEQNVLSPETLIFVES